MFGGLFSTLSDPLHISHQNYCLIASPSHSHMCVCVRGSKAMNVLLIKTKPTIFICILHIAISQSCQKYFSWDIHIYIYSASHSISYHRCHSFNRTKKVTYTHTHPTSRLCQITRNEFGSSFFSNEINDSCSKLISFAGGFCRIYFGIESSNSA